ncbi:MAG: glycosyltransferase family 4 protein [Candidatus Korobacteraceae bacterium]
MRILWVKCDFLHPTTRGGQIRTLEIVKRLHARHEVHYVSYDSAENPEGLRRATEYCTRVYPVRREIPHRRSLAFVGQLVGNLFSSMPLSLSRYHSPAMQKQIANVLKSADFDAVVCDFLAPAPNFENLGRCVLFQHNLETMIWRRHASNAPDPLRKLYFRSQADRMFHWEQRMCRAAAEVIAVSPQDADQMRHMFGVTRVTAIPTGVDIEYFRRPTEVARKTDLVFLGSMDWLPNIDGVEYFVREILPLIRQRVPECTLAIVGRAPSASTKALAERHAGIQVTGTVADVRPWLWGSKISVVPLRIGGGTRLKIYESMAAGTPTVSTSIGAEGLDVSHPKNIRLADTPAAFAEQCIELLDDAQERERLAAEALKLVTAHFSWDVVTAEFERLLLAARNPVPASQDRIAAPVRS